MLDMSTASAPPAMVPTRRISFEESLQDLPKHFAADGDLLHSHLAASLSAVFPDGEDFFVRSVRHYRDQITDPELKRQVAGFIGQEAIHGREHRVLQRPAGRARLPDQALRALHQEGPGDARPAARRPRRTSPPPPPSSTSPPPSPSCSSPTPRRARCSATTRCATCSCGTPSRRPSTRRWRSTSTRPSAAPSGCGPDHEPDDVRLPRRHVVQIIVSVLGDRETLPAGSSARAWQRFRRSPFLSQGMWRQLRDYNRPDFHPDDRDTDRPRRPLARASSSATPAP